MQHSFDISIATKYGIEVAIFLNNIAHWTSVNMANDTHSHDGRYWTYNTQKAFCILFPYWKRGALRTVINNCIEKGLIITGNYNEKKYDNTTWYALTDKGLSLFPFLENIKKSSKINDGCIQPSRWLKPTTPVAETSQPIPDSKPDNKTQKSFYKKTNEKKHDFAEKMKKIEPTAAVNKQEFFEADPEFVQKYNESNHDRSKIVNNNMVNNNRSNSHGSESARTAKERTEIPRNNIRGNGVRKVEGYLPY